MSFRGIVTLVATTSKTAEAFTITTTKEKVQLFLPTDA